MPARQTYQLHRYAARPSNLAPADKASRSALAKKARAIKAKAAGNRTRELPVVVTRGFLSDLRKLWWRWGQQANELEKSPGAKLITDAAARRAAIRTLRRTSEALKDLIEKEGA